MLWKKIYFSKHYIYFYLTKWHTSLVTGHRIIYALLIASCDISKDDFTVREKILEDREGDSREAKGRWAKCKQAVWSGAKHYQSTTEASQWSRYICIIKMSYQKRGHSYMFSRWTSIQWNKVPQRLRAEHNTLSVWRLSWSLKTRHTPIVAEWQLIWKLTKDERTVCSQHRQKMAYIQLERGREDGIRGNGQGGEKKKKNWKQSEQDWVAWTAAAAQTQGTDAVPRWITLKEIIIVLPEKEHAVLSHL